MQLKKLHAAQIVCVRRLDIRGEQLNLRQNQFVCLAILTCQKITFNRPKGAMHTRRTPLKRKTEPVKAKHSKTSYFQLCFLLCSFYFLLLTFPAQAARLQSWRLNASQNQLEFSTDEGVQPKAQLISDPTRLVIDLPGVRLGRPQVTEPYTGAIRSIRVGQFDASTARIVVEYAPGYTIDPNQVKFRGAAANQWSVQLPTPQFSNVSNPAPVSQLPPPGSPTPQPNQGGGSLFSRAFVQTVQPTPDGFFIRMSGTPSNVQSTRSSDRRQQFIDLYGASISPNLVQRDIPVNRNGVERVQVDQFQASPPIVRLTLTVSPNSPDWRASSSTVGGVVLLPQSGSVPIGQTPQPQPLPQPLPQPQTPTVQSISFENQQLIVRADRPISYTTGWDRPTGAYRLLVRSARLDPNLPNLQLPANSPLLQVRVRQEGSDVAILMTPAANVQFGQATQINAQQVALPVRRGLFPTVPPTTNPIPAPLPNPTIPIPPTPNPQPIPRPVPNGRLVVVVDAGHGGPDPGAIGIGGLQEKELVLDISRRLQARLEQSGVQVVMTRNADIDLDLQPRVDIAQRANATVFVSIHANSINLSRQDISGLETYYYQSGLELARSIHRSVIQGTGIQDRGVRSARFYVLRRTTMPSVLVEVGFVTGRDDAAKLRTSSYRQQMAESIARGVLQYLGRRN